MKKRDGRGDRGKKSRSVGGGGGGGGGGGRGVSVSPQIKKKEEEVMQESLQKPNQTNKTKKQARKIDEFSKPRLWNGNERKRDVGGREGGALKKKKKERGIGMKTKCCKS